MAERVRLGERPDQSPRNHAGTVSGELLRLGIGLGRWAQSGVAWQQEPAENQGTNDQTETKQNQAAGLGKTIQE